MEKYLYANEENETSEDMQTSSITFRGTPGSGIKQAREILYGDETEGFKPTDDLNCGKLSKLIRYIMKGSISVSIWICYAETLAYKA